MKKVLVLLTAMTVGSNLLADDFTYLTVEKNDGTTTTMTANGLTITFSNGQLIANNGTENWSLPLSGLKKMYFSNTDAISHPLSDTGDSEVTVYSTSGIVMGKYQSIGEAKSQLKKGVYVIKSGSETLKITVK